MSPDSTPPPTHEAPARRRYVPAVGPRLRKLLFVVFGLFALLAVNSTYLASVTLFEWLSGRTYQNWFYMIMFLLHLVLGLLIVVPLITFGIAHIRNSYDRRNRRAVKVGYALFTAALILLASGIVLTRIEGLIVVKDATVRSFAYWAHVIAPLAAIWLFILHRLAGKKIKWKVGMRWATVAAVFAGVLLIVQAQDPRKWNVEGPKTGSKYFYPSLARTATGNFIPAKALMNDKYCADCHPTVHKSWLNSVHRFSSFNNPPYFFSVSETKRLARAHDPNDQSPRFCAGCHDPVVFFSGKFDDPKFDDPKYDLRKDPTSTQGITCSVCHSITHVNSQRGNSDYTIEEPEQYPFAYSDNRLLSWVNRTLIKAKPEFHKKTFLKPLHKTAEFCAGCHKVFLPQELNHYKWLRGQNHYDSFLLSGVSGHGVASFYYPKKAEANCNGCHMKPKESTDFAARYIDDKGVLQVHDHQFPSANTGLAHLLKLGPDVIAAHEKFNNGEKGDQPVMRLDLFGIKEGGTIDGALTAPLRPAVPALKPGRSYLVETVIRTLKMGHHFTQGTTDSNEVWVDLTVSSGGKVIGRSGGLGPDRGVDPWSHFVNVYMLDRNGHRIDRRNAQDIFTPLYNHQIPPGAADVIHYRLDVPREVRGPITVEAQLRYRKFDTTYLKMVYPEMKENDLPIMTLAHDKVVFPIAGGAPVTNPPFKIDPELAWQRWNDYGIGLLLKGGKSKGELAQAEVAFAEVEKLGQATGAVNRARVYLEQGTVQDKAIAALQRAAAMKPPAPPWSVAWFSGLVNKQNGFLDEAIANYESILKADNSTLRERGFDFTKDYRLLDELGETLLERSRLDRGADLKPARDARLKEAIGLFEQALALDPENTSAHYNLELIYRLLGDKAKADEHHAAFDKYRVDDNARDRAIAIARQNDPAASHAADAIVIYDLRRAGAFELGAPAPGAPPPPDGAAPVSASVPASGGP